MNKWLNKLDLKSLLLGIAVAALLIVATWALAVFFDGPGRGQAWPAAISAVSSIVLVVVTAIYAGITGRSVHLQEIAIADLRRQEEAGSVRRVLDSVYPWIRQVRELGRLFPLDKTSAMPNRSLLLNKSLVEAGNELRAVSVQLPARLKAQSLHTSVLLLKAYQSCQVVITCVQDATIANLKQEIEILQRKAEDPKDPEREPTWQEVRAAFYSDEARRRDLNLQEGESLIEWEDLSRGLPVSAAEAALKDLETALANWLNESTLPLSRGASR